MSLSPGTRLGPYEITEAVGAGGMGDVYAAHDARLKRTVAIKVCREEFSARFEREARAIAALNHHNICTLYDVGPNFLVMEMVYGLTLAEIIATRPVSLLESMRIASQIAQALAAAHDHGVVHGDLKPANIKVAPVGLVKVLDFGLAKTIGGAAPDALTLTGPAQTVAGVLMGTVAYMSPEQAQGLPVDHRSDIWAVGIVLYQMLARRTPFEGSTTERTILDILHKPLPVVPNVPRKVMGVVARCLQKDREARYQSADALGVDLDACVATLTRDSGGLVAALRRPRVAIPAAILLAGVTLTGAWSWRRARVERWARQTAIPEVYRLADAGDIIAAFNLAGEVERFIPGDRAVQDLWRDVSQAVSVQSEPAGATVTWKPYAGADSAWHTLGTTPVTAAQLPAVPLRLRLDKPGYAPIEVAAPGRQYRVTLAPEGDLPPGMVRVPAGNLRVNYAGIGALTGAIGPFDIDRFEVTNREFKEFVDKGGYRTRTFWTEPMIDNGRTLSWEAAMARLVDPTGRPGPSTWQAGSHAEGHGDDPVAGVSWYEAAAYAAFAGKRLPTVYHWFRAAHTDDSRFTIPLSNFASGRVVRAGQSQALGSLGTVDMAGNVREWCWNANGAQRYILGGSYADQSYMLTRGQLAPALDRSSTNGFRCIRDQDSSRSAALMATIAADTPPAYLTARPVSEAVFQLYEGVYAYERTDLAAKVESVDESSELWRREKVSFDAGYGGERVVAYLFMPRHAAGPVACVVVVPSASQLAKRTSSAIRPDSYILRSGRAMLYPVFKGTYERSTGASSFQPVEIRDGVVAWRKEMSRSLDYLETRKDIDLKKIGYLGHSMGSEVAPMLLSMERRFAAAALLSGGLTPSFGKLPEVNAVNFLPRVKTPVLMVNGKYDSILPAATAQEPMFQQLGTPTADKRRVVVDSGHTVMTPETQNTLIKAVLDWFDRYL